MSKVTVVADKNGNLISVSPNNPEYGWFFVEQELFQFSTTGWLKKVKRKARIMGKTEDLLSTGYREGTSLPGKIVVVESLTPFNAENPDRDLKVAGETGVICRIDDQPIYRQSFYTTNVNASDELITHDNSDEIRDVQTAQKEMSSFKMKTEETVNL